MYQIRNFWKNPLLFIFACFGYIYYIFRPIYIIKTKNYNSSQIYQNYQNSYSIFYFFFICGFFFLNFIYILKFCKNGLKNQLFFFFWNFQIFLNSFFLSFLGFFYFLHEQENLIFLLKSSLFLFFTHLLALEKVIQNEKSEFSLFFFNFAGNGTFFFAFNFEVFRIIGELVEEYSVENVVVLVLFLLGFFVWGIVIKKNYVFKI